MPCSATDGKPAATVEAKKLGEVLSTHRIQMLNYANASGIEYAGVTDGDHWELYSVFESSPLDERTKIEYLDCQHPGPQKCSRNCCCSGGPTLRPAGRCRPLHRFSMTVGATIDPDPIPPIPTPDTAPRAASGAVRLGCALRIRPNRRQSMSGRNPILGRG